MLSVVVRSWPWPVTFECWRRTRTLRSPKAARLFPPRGAVASICCGSLGHQPALRFLCTTEAVDHDVGKRVGLYDQVAADGQSVESAVDDFVAPMLKQPAHVLRSYKALATAARMGGNRAELEKIEITRFAKNWVHEDHWTALDRFLSRSRK